MKKKKILLIVLSSIVALALVLFVVYKVVKPGANDPSTSDSSTSDSSTPDSSTPDSSTPDSSTPDEEAELTHITYLSGLDADAYVKGEDLDLSTLKITAHYADESSNEVLYNVTDFVVTYNSNVEGYSAEADVTIEYKGKTCTKTLLFGSKYRINEVGLIASYANYLTVVRAETPIFTRVNEGYKVGDDNAFSVRPTVVGINNFDEQENDDIQDITFVVVVEKWVNNTYVVMENPSTDVVIDQDLATVDFEESAIGNKYRVSVYPDMLYQGQIEENGLETYTATIELEVVNGYNVYDLLGLSLIDNTINNDNSKGDDWKAMRHAAGLTVDSNTISGIVLHANIAVTPEGIPSSFLFNDGDSDLNPSDADYARAKGSLRDYAYILRRNLQPNQHFDVHGNYFNVNASALPLVVRPNNEAVSEGATVIPHSSLLWIGCNDTQEVCNATEVTINNLNCLGNLQLEETNTTGGIIFFKSAQQKVLLNNLVARQWYITAFPQLQDSAEYAMTIKDNQYYDNYNSFVYNWGSYINIENSVMKTCGGPVIIADNSNHKEGQTTTLHPNGWIPTINVDDASVLESWVTGGESWFVQMNANSLAAAIQQLDGLFNYHGQRTFINGGKMNLIMVMKSGSTESVNFLKILGSCNIGENGEQLAFSMSNPLVQAFNGASVLFQGANPAQLAAINVNGTTQYLTDAQGLAYYTATQGAAGDISPIGPTHGVFTGNYLGVYLGAAFAGGAPEGYMGVVFGGYRPLG